MDIDSRSQGQILILTPLEQRFDEDNRRDLKNYCVNAINQGHNHILFNLQNVEFIDSSGLGVFISILKLLDRIGEIYFCEFQHQVDSIFEQTRLNRVFKVFDTEKIALESLKTLSESVSS
ncbi:MAG: STAS domain-containing protein [Parachlamydiales bacterium]|nr:STAS domain-containing protein [Parachlamydiales bacterium]